MNRQTGESRTDMLYKFIVSTGFIRQNIKLISIHSKIMFSILKQDCQIKSGTAKGILRNVLRHF